MGNGPGCCKMESLPKAKTSIAAAPIAGVYPGLQTFKQYALRYQEIQLVASTNVDGRHRVSEIRCLSNGLLYACRRAPFKEAPLQSSPDLIAKHLETLFELDHPHICKLVEVFCDDEGGDYLLVSERADQPNILDYIDEHGLPNGDIDTADIIRQILTGLAHGHERGIVHGRLRHDVILLAAPDGGGHKASPTTKERKKEAAERDVRIGPPQIKIADMGLGYVLREPIRTSNAGYEGCLFIPPEHAWEEAANPRPLLHDMHQEAETPAADATSASAASGSPRGSISPRDSQLLALPPPVGITGHWAETPGTRRGVVPAGADKVDVWAVGVLAFNILTGLLPFEANNEKQLLEHLRCHKPKFTKDPWSEISSKAVNAVQLMLTLSADMRPTAKDLLRHQWLRLQRDPVSKPRIYRLFRNAVVNLYEGQFKKLVGRVIAKQLSSSHEHKSEAHEVFQALDKDRDGLLSYKEFTNGLKKVPELEQYLVDAGMLFEACDRNNSGAIDVTEFTSATLPPSEARDERNLWQVFRAFDQNETGSITLDEVQNVIELLEGSMMAPPQIKELSSCIRAELETLGFGRNVLVDLGVHDHDDDSALAKMGEKIFGFLPCGHRRLDFGEFAYLCSTKDSSCKLPNWMRKEAYRCVDICCDVDMYHQAHRTGNLAWPPLQGASARTPECVYERSGLAADTQKRRESRKRSAHRYAERVRAEHIPHESGRKFDRFHPLHHGHHWHHGHHHIHDHHIMHHHHRHVGHAHHDDDDHLASGRHSGRGAGSARPGSTRGESGRGPPKEAAAKPSAQKPTKKLKKGTSDYDSEPEESEEEDDDDSVAGA